MCCIVLPFWICRIYRSAKDSTSVITNLLSSLGEARVKSLPAELRDLITLQKFTQTEDETDNAPADENWATLKSESVDSEQDKPHRRDNHSNTTIDKSLCAYDRSASQTRHTLLSSAPSSTEQTTPTPVVLSKLSSLAAQSCFVEDVGSHDGTLSNKVIYLTLSIFCSRFLYAIFIIHHHHWPLSVNFKLSSF